MMATDLCAPNYGLDTDGENGRFYGYQILEITMACHVVIID